MIKKVSLREAYKNAVLNDPAASRKDAFRHFLETVRSNPAYLDLLAEEYFDRMAAQWQPEKVGKDSYGLVATSVVKRRSERSAERRAESKERIAEAKAEIAKTMRPFIFFEMIMPNGKKAKDCTGAELVSFGGGFTEVGKSIKPNQVVHKHLSEREFADIFSRAGKSTKRRRSAAGADLHA